MMDTDFSLLLALILFIVLVVFDLVFYRFRHNKSIEDEPEFSPAREVWDRVKAWVASLRTPSTGPEGIETPEANALVPEVEAAPALPAREREVIITQVPAPESQKPAAPVPSVHVQISADIPEGTVVHITMQVVNREGKVVLEQAGVTGQTLIERPSGQSL